MLLHCLLQCSCRCFRRQKSTRTAKAPSSTKLPETSTSLSKTRQKHHDFPRFEKHHSQKSPDSHILQEIIHKSSLVIRQLILHTSSSNRANCLRHVELTVTHSPHQLQQQGQMSPTLCSSKARQHQLEHHLAQGLKHATLKHSKTHRGQQRSPQEEIAARRSKHQPR